jgi:hypothetical protein
MLVDTCTHTGGVVVVVVVLCVIAACSRQAGISSIRLACACAGASRCLCDGKEPRWGITGFSVVVLVSGGAYSWAHAHWCCDCCSCGMVLAYVFAGHPGTFYR